MSFRDIDPTITSNRLNLAATLVALLPVPPRYHLKRAWKINYHEETTNQQSTVPTEVLWAYFSLSGHAIQHWNSNALCSDSDAAMISCHLCLDG